MPKEPLYPHVPQKKKPQFPHGAGPHVRGAKIIKADGTTQELDHRPSLKEAQGIVGGYIELLHPRGGITLVVDEEGRLKNKPLNAEASRVYGSDIVGDVIVLYGWQTVGS